MISANRSGHLDVNIGINFIAVAAVGLCSRLLGFFKLLARR